MEFLMNHKNIELLEKVQHGEVYFPVQLYRPFLNDYNRILLDHWHRHFEISYIMSGNAVYTINFQDYQVHEGDIIIMAPECLHSGKSIPGIYSENITILFDPSILETLQFDSCTSNYIAPLINNDIIISSYIKNARMNAKLIVDTIFQIAAVIQEKSICYELQIKSLIYQLLYHLYNQGFAKASHSSEFDKHASDQVKNIIEYINANYKNKIYIEDIANHTGYSMHYLSRFFKKETKISCTEYINKVRINKAVEFLCNTDKSITEIALDCGFFNVSYFLKKFREIYHVTPKDYRNTYSTKML